MSAAARKSQPAGATERRAFLTFVVGQDTFAVPLDAVSRIVRRMPLVPVPMAPPALEGLANLGGAVLPVASLRRVFGHEATRPVESARIVVVDGTRPLGLAVDRVTASVRIDTAALGKAEDVPSDHSRRDLLGGMVRLGDDGRTALLLDPGRLAESEFAHLAAAPARRAAASTAAPGGRAEPGRGRDARKVFVSFATADQDYALPADAVRELITMPADVVRVPHAEDGILGVATLRDGLLPLVSLRGLLRLPPAGEGQDRQVVVASDGNAVVGLVIDRLKSVLRIDAGAIDPLPPLLARTDGGFDVDALARLDGGRRLVSILPPGGLFGHRTVRAAIDASTRQQQTEDAMPAEGTHTGGAATAQRHSFLLFTLAGQEYAVPAAAIEEIMRVPETLTRVPKTPAFVAGVANRRGSVLPVIDLYRRFELGSAARQGDDGRDRQRILVVSMGGVVAGLLVDRARTMLRVPAESIRDAPDLSEEQARLVGRVISLDDDQRLILVLDPERLFATRELRTLDGVAKKADAGGADAEQA